MKGSVLSFDVKSDTGVISGDDGRQHPFVLDEWQAGEPPGAGLQVAFDVGDDGRASGIVRAVVERSGKSRIVAAMLAAFLGAFGVHKFYLGARLPGGIMLAVALIGLLLTAVPTLFVGLIAFAEFILYMTISDQEFDRRYIRGGRHWF